VKAKDVHASIVVLGTTSSGKTSYLSTIYGTRNVVRGDVTWRVEVNDTDTQDYLKVGFSRLCSGLALDKTLPDAQQPRLLIELYREDAECVTHTLQVDCLDLAGEYARPNSELRSGAVWDEFSRRIREASVVLLVIDGLNVIYADSGLQHAGVNPYLGYDDLLEQAMRGAAKGALKKKSLAVLFSKCDAIDEFKIDGIDDDRDAEGLARRLLPEDKLLYNKMNFAAVKYFAASVLREEWRWTRDGACVHVGGGRPVPVGLFEPFEWICSLHR
jgi:hypothetical protein